MLLLSPSRTLHTHLDLVGEISELSAGEGHLLIRLESGKVYSLPIFPICHAPFSPYLTFIIIRSLARAAGGGASAAARAGGARTFSSVGHPGRANDVGGWGGRERHGGGGV